MSITLAELKTQARQLADMEENEFVSDSELTNYINFGIAELHDLLIGTFADYYLQSTTNTTTVDQDTYALPDDFYKLRGVDAKLNGSNYFTLRRYNFNERNRYEDFGAWTLAGISNVRYRVMGSNIVFTPIPDGQTEYKIWYVPKATKLVADSDSFDDVNQYADFVIITAAMKMLVKEESDVSTLAAERARLIDKIEQDAKDRDIGEPESISDVHAENNTWFYYTSRS